MKEKLKIQDIYRLHILPTMANPARCTLKSSDTLIAYVICIFRYMFLEDGLSESDFDQLKKTAVIKTRENKFLSLGSLNMPIHLTKIYGFPTTLESFDLPKHQLNFISDDYLTKYQDDLFKDESKKRKFCVFLDRLRIGSFLKIDPVDRCKSMIRLPLFQILFKSFSID
jgi:hypothetical protein